jgi:hypothetical protein
VTGHVSQLVLDELASGIAAPPGAKAHVEACAECRARLAALEAARVSSEQAFGYARVKARLTAERPSRWRELMPFIVPVVAALVFFVVVSIDWRPSPDRERLKGSAFVELVAGGQAVTEARPGAKLQLKVGTAGKTHAFVLSVDKDRNVEELWAGQLPPGAVVTLPMELEVTPGSVTVHAFLADAPPDPKVVVPAMQAAMVEYAGWPLEAPPPKLEGLTVATQRLYVKP